jgi:FKBP-type peptidyl-prolyl cis-trans isomerase
MRRWAAGGDFNNVLSWKENKGMMMIVNKRARLLALTAFLSFFVALGFAQSSITSIELTYKRDPRQVDPFRGLGPWAAGPGYGGATAQDHVEVRAEGVDAAGRKTKINPHWTASDPAMVAVTPSQGNDVTIKVLRAGESTLKISDQGFSMELVVKAQYVGNNFIVFGIEPAAKPKPATRPIAGAPSVLKSKSDVSYAVGINLANAMQEQSVELDVDSLLQGVRDGLSGGKTRMTDEQALAALAGMYIDQRIVEEGQNRKAIAAKNKREGEAFLAENRNREGVVTLPSGLQYKVLKAGDGKKPSASDTVTVQYRGTFIDGKEFNSSSKGAGSVNFPVQSVMKGWQEALQLMPVGSKWQLFVPPDLAYGERGAGGHGGKRAGGQQPQIVGPEQTLVFEIDLLGIQEPGAQPAASSVTAEKNQVTPEMVDELVKALQAAQSKTETKPDQKVENQ